MGQENTTFQIDELISSYIDNQITDPELKSQIEEKLRTDIQLNAKYKTELLTKNLLKARLPQYELPAETYAKITGSIDNLIASVSKKKEIPLQSHYPSFWQSVKEAVSAPLMGIPRYTYAALAILIIVGAVLVFGGNKKQLNPYITSGTDKSIMVQAVKSFHKILKGEVKPQLTTSNAAEVEKFVKEKSEFSPYLPSIENYKLTGVVCSEYNGHKLAHIIYMNGDEMIYIYQAPVNAVVKNDLDLPKDVHNEIVSAKYFMCDAVDETDCTMTLWIKDNILCASMTTMPKQKMYATFTSFYK